MWEKKKKMKHGRTFIQRPCLMANDLSAGRTNSTWRELGVVSKSVYNPRDSSSFFFSSDHETLWKYIPRAPLTTQNYFQVRIFNLRGGKKNGCIIPRSAVFLGQQKFKKTYTRRKVIKVNLVIFSAFVRFTIFLE